MYGKQLVAIAYLMDFCNTLYGGILVEMETTPVYFTY